MQAVVDAVNKLKGIKSCGFMCGSDKGIIHRSFDSPYVMLANMQADQSIYWDKKDIAFHFSNKELESSARQPLPVVKNIKDFKNGNVKYEVCVAMDLKDKPQVPNKQATLEQQYILDLLSSLADDFYKQKSRWIGNWGVLKGDFVFFRNDYSFNFVGNFFEANGKKLTIMDMLKGNKLGYSIDAINNSKGIKPNKSNKGGKFGARDKNAKRNNNPAKQNRTQNNYSKHKKQKSHAYNGR